MDQGDAEEMVEWFRDHCQLDGPHAVDIDEWLNENPEGRSLAKWIYHTEDQDEIVVGEMTEADGLGRVVEQQLHPRTMRDMEKLAAFCLEQGFRLVNSSGLVEPTWRYIAIHAMAKAVRTTMEPREG